MFVVTMFAVSAVAAQDCRTRVACKAACERVDNRIAAIHARMRSGYGAREGEKMQAELRRLRERRLKVCR